MGGQQAELEVVKQAEAAIRQGLRRQVERRKRAADQLQLLREVSDTIEAASWPL